MLLAARPGAEPALARLPVPLTCLGGQHAAQLQAEGDLAARRQDLWPRVWALRALRYVWRGDLEGAVVHCLDDPAWRVREMAAAVAAVREIGPAADRAAGLLTDPVPRVRAAALRAVAVTGEHEHVDAVRRALGDAAPQVRRAASRAGSVLAERLDLPTEPWS